MVGGVVRDLLLKRRNDDIDFVVEGDAIRFAESLQARYGGQVHSYRPFGTATWLLDGASVDGDWVCPITSISPPRATNSTSIPPPCRRSTAARSSWICSGATSPSTRWRCS